jgi:hypothetical protein
MIFTARDFEKANPARITEGVTGADKWGIVPLERLNAGHSTDR